MIITETSDLEKSKELIELANTNEINQLPEALKEGLILFESNSGNASHAEVLYDKFNLDSTQVLARLTYLCGDFDKAAQLAIDAGDTYLHCEILIASNKFQEALAILKNEPICATWYYYSGVVYSHMALYKKAIACLEKANEIFNSETNLIQKVMTLSNLATCYNSNGEVSKATKLFANAADLFKSIDKQIFPRFCSKFFVNYGFHLMQTGKLHQSFKYLKLAEKLIGANRSEEYYRTQVFLAYVMKQMGYYHKAITILKNVAPTVKYLNVDRLRYLAECYTDIGDLEKSKLTIEQALSLSDDDKFAQVFLNLIIYQNQILEGSVSLAEKTFVKIESLCLETQDESNWDFALGKKAVFTNDVVIARSQVSKLRNLEFEVEALDCTLTIATKLVTSGNYQGALAMLSREDFSLCPLQLVEVHLLKGICHRYLKQTIQSKESLETAYNLSKVRKNTFLMAKCLIVQMSLTIDFLQLISLHDKYLEIATGLESWQKRNLTDFIENLNCETRFNVTIDDVGTNIRQTELAKIFLSPEIIVLDLTNLQLIHAGRTSISLRDFPVQWDLLTGLAKCKAASPLSKEMISNQILGRQDYNPITDDNNINVTLHRLRKNLKKILGFDPIMTKEGNYFVNPSFKMAILENPKVVKSLQVS